MLGSVILLAISFLESKSRGKICKDQLISAIKFVTPSAVREMVAKDTGVRVLLY